MRLGPGLLYEGRTLQGARPKLADFCSATMAEFYSAVDRCPAHAKNKPGCHRKKAHGNDERAAPRATLSIHISAVFVDLHFKLGLGQFLEKRYTSIETFAA